MLSKSVLLPIVLLLMVPLPVVLGGDNFSTGDEAAAQFGVHEIVLTGNGPSGTVWQTVLRGNL